MFFLVYCLFTLTIFDLGQRLLIWPAVLLRPAKRRAIVRAWLRFLARAVTLASPASPAAFASRFMVHRQPRAASGDESPVAARHHHRRSRCQRPASSSSRPAKVTAGAFPGISSLINLGRFPLVTQQPRPSKAEVAALLRAANELATAKRRSSSTPKATELRTAPSFRSCAAGCVCCLQRAHRPIYYVVADGLSHARTFKDVAALASPTAAVHVEIRGPFPPPDTSTIDAFIDDLHAPHDRNPRRDPRVNRRNPPPVPSQFRRPLTPALRRELAAGLDDAPSADASALAAMLARSFGPATVAIIHYGSHAQRSDARRESAFDFFVIVDRYRDAYDRSPAPSAPAIRRAPPPCSTTSSRPT